MKAAISLSSDDLALSSPLAVQLRIVELKGQRALARRMASDYAARRLPSLAAPHRGRVVALGRRILALEEHLKGMAA